MAAPTKDQILDWLQDRWLDFKARGVYFQVKTGMIAAYAAIVFVTLLVTPVEKAPFEMRYFKQKSGLGTVTVVEIVNRDLGILNNITVAIEGSAVLFDGKRKPGKWTTQVTFFGEEGELKPLLVRPSVLKDDQGFPAPPTLDVSRVFLLDEDGDEIVSGVPKQKQTKP